MEDMTMTNKEVKSEVMRLGNKLAARMSRHDAFVQAWAAVKAESLELPVKGVSIGNRQEALRRLAAYDPSQVRVWTVPETPTPSR
jgi:hypothetical protein